MSTLIQRLNDAYARNPDPDAVARSLNDPTTLLWRCGTIPADVLKLFEEIDFCFYYIKGKCWESCHPIEDVYKHTIERFSGGLNRPYLTGFAVTSYEHRREADLTCFH